MILERYCYDFKNTDYIVLAQSLWSRMERKFCGGHNSREFKQILVIMFTCAFYVYNVSDAFRLEILYFASQTAENQAKSKACISLLSTDKQRDRYMKIA